MNYLYALIVLFWACVMSVGLFGAGYDKALPAFAAGVLAVGVAWLFAPAPIVIDDHPLKRD